MTFKRAVEEGLSSTQKHISSRYFYDDEGSKLFQLIMKSPEYYLTNCEEEIFLKQSESIVKRMSASYKRVRLIDLGAGDGIKTLILLKQFLQLGIEVVYTPVDISEKAIIEAKKNIQKTLPQLKIEPFIGEYYEALEKIDNVYTQLPNIMLLLGSNIGNFTHDNAIRFLTQINELSHERDKLFVGFDLKKDPKIIRRAYDDKLGITRRFNLNLLARINRELGGEFKIEQFDHYNSYNPITGTARSYIISLLDQEVYIQGLDKTISFEAFEPIDVEQSQKYDLKTIEKMAKGSNYKVLEYFFDEKRYYTNCLMEK